MDCVDTASGGWRMWSCTVEKGGTFDPYKVTTVEYSEYEDDERDDNSGIGEIIQDQMLEDF